MTYTIGTLAGLTGLSAHTIRAWERRYGALSPGRTETNRRVYADEDLRRLNLLKQIVAAGHSIGQVAHLSTEELRSISPAPGAPPPRTEARSASLTPSADSFYGACMDAVERFAADDLEQSLVRSAAALGVSGMLDGVVVPLLREVGIRWSDGTLRIAQEHMASAVLRTYLDGVRRSMPVAPGARHLLMTTPRGQIHELGALLVAIVAATENWNVTYLGPNLPASEIAAAARAGRADAIGLSMVYPRDDTALADELRTLRASVGHSMPILVGGRATPHYAAALNEIGARICSDLDVVRSELAEIAR